MYVAYFDGACSPNPGNCSYGISLQRDKIEIGSLSQRIGRGTNNVAEYFGVIGAIQMAIERNIENCEVVGDSLLVVNQINGHWKVHDKKLRVLCDIAKAQLG